MREEIESSILAWLESQSGYIATSSNEVTFDGKIQVDKLTDNIMSDLSGRL